MSRVALFPKVTFVPVSHEASQPEAAMFSEALEAERKSIMLPAVVELFVWSLSMPTRVAWKNYLLVCHLL